MIRFLQISDLHFGVPSLNPFQIFSKRCLANLYYIFHRKKHFIHSSLKELAFFCQEKGVSHVFISGDLTVSSRTKEFAMAANFVKELQSQGLEVISVAGNHDHYTKKSCKERKFYQFFDSLLEESCPFNLKEHRISYQLLGPHLWLIALDTSHATAPFSSAGVFSTALEERLKKVLSHIPSSDAIILLNHYPPFEHLSSKHSLDRHEALKTLLLEHPNVFLYLHGHTHQQTIADLRGNQLPIISNCGSTVEKGKGACHLFELTSSCLTLESYQYDQGWKKKALHRFSR